MRIPAMRSALRWTPLALLAACAGAPTSRPAPAAFALPDSTALLAGASGRTASAAELLERARAADIVLLGEVHDNPVGHALRGALITTLADRHPAIVFEQFAAADAPIAPPAPGDSLEGWLDRNGFDRRGWKWPLHRPVIAAALAHARSLWGSGLSRAELVPVVMNGDSGAPPPLRDLMARVPLDSMARGVLDRELIEGHCNQLPAEMIPGMRSAQVVRDASMTRALLRAAADGPAFLVAGNGHVRKDVAVPRLLQAAAPARSVLVIGVLERDSSGAMPDAAERRMYDYVFVTPRAQRDDPCAALRGRE